MRENHFWAADVAVVALENVGKNLAFHIKNSSTDRLALDYDDIGYNRIRQALQIFCENFSKHFN